MKRKSKNKTLIIVNEIISFLLLLFVLYWFVVIAGLAQIVAEGRTGYWSSFWKWGADVIINFIK